MFLFGGYNSDNVYKTDLWKYDVATNQSSIVDVQGGTPPVSASTASLRNTMVHVRGFLWLYGEAGLWVVSPEEGTWRDAGGKVKGASPPSRTDHGCAEADDRLYVFGGKLNDDVLNDLWMLDGIEGRLRPETALVWTELSPGGSAPDARKGLRMAALGGRMYIFGGEWASGKRLS